ncbi:MAG: hypothetical protein FWE03_02780 [Firmicutes bacterium]|nr:hypothetical protein [Bacillota bacterium]
MKNIIKNKIEQSFYGKLRFCTPGHKGRGEFCSVLLDYDVTEIEAQFPSNAISLAEQKTAKLLNVNRVRFLVNGSSIGIKAALLSLGKDSGDILVTKNIHPAIEHAAILLRVKIFYCDNDYPDKNEIFAALKKYPSVGTVVLTSPDYYGVAIKKEAGQAVADMGKKLFIDAAHGAHFLFRPEFFDCSLFKYAYAYNLSAHKTLPSLTQTAYLIINDEKYSERIDKSLEILGTTSPSYPFYMSLEDASQYTYDNREYYDELRQFIQQFKQKVPCVDNDDFTRLVVDCTALKTDGQTLYSKLLDKGIVAEKFDETRVVFIVSIMDTKKGLEGLCKAILED